MAAELNKLAQEFKRKGHPGIADSLIVLANAARDLELGVSESFRESVTTEKPSLKAIRLLTRAEQVGLGDLFAIHFLSGVETLVDITPRPNFENNGRQLHKNDRLGPLMARLRKEGKISTIKDIPETSRFWISPEVGVIKIVLPEIARLLGVDESEVRLPTEAEFNALRQFYPHFKTENTGEWLNDKHPNGIRKIGDGSDYGGMVYLYDPTTSSGPNSSIVTFRPLVVVPPEA